MGEPAPAEIRNKLEDLSGIVLQPGENPYAALINACDNDRKEIQALYNAHRTKRNAQQKDKFLSDDFQGLIIDQTLLKLENPTIQPGFKDKRHCMTFWARPPQHVLDLAAHLQGLLKQHAPNIWLMPVNRMHMTTLEPAFSKTPEEIAALITTLHPAMASIASLTHTHRSRLTKPMISYDTSAFAVSFLPAVDEPVLSPPPSAPDTAVGVVRNDDYTYHHLRRDVFDGVQDAGVQVGSRYQVPSAHITLGRYLTEDDHNTPEKRQAWIKAIDGINQWLEDKVWDNVDGEFIGEWIVGQERGLDVRSGTLWYGGGRTLTVGEGF